MVVTLPPELESAVQNAAQNKGTTVESLVLDALRDRFVPKRSSFEPQDEWERKLLSIGIPCGVSLTDEQVSSEGIYE